MRFGSFVIDENGSDETLKGTPCYIYSGVASGWVWEMAGRPEQQVIFPLFGTGNTFFFFFLSLFRREKNLSCCGGEEQKTQCPPQVANFQGKPLYT